MTKSIDTPEMAKTSPSSQHTNEIATYLGIDYGKSKVGLAIADEETKMAFAFDTLKNDKELFSSLKEIVECENVKTIVIGLTRHERDLQSAQEKMDFASLLKEEIPVQVVFEEEMFTTKMAQANIKTHGTKNIAQTDDQEAARIILQSWLDRN